MESAFDPGLIYMMGNSLHPNSFRYTCLIIARHGSEPRNLVQNPTRSFDHLLLFPPPRALCQNKVPFCFLSSFRARARERERDRNKYRCPNKPYLFRRVAAITQHSIRACPTDDLFHDLGAESCPERSPADYCCSLNAQGRQRGDKNKKFLSLGESVCDDPMILSDLPSGSTPALLCFCLVL